MNGFEDIPSLRKYVLTKRDKDEKGLEAAAISWKKAAQENKLSYEIDWLGIPVIQTAEDLVLMQELIFKVRPDTIIETGIAHGGSLIFYASIMELLGNGRVIGVDIEIREHNRKVMEMHPLFKRVHLIEGNSISEETVNKIRKLVPPNSKIIVCLDSNHAREHVFQELKAYRQFVGAGGYIVVFDTDTSKLAELGACDKSFINNGPMEAVNEFLKIDENFEIDRHYNKLYVSNCPNGYLKKIK